MNHSERIYSSPFGNMLFIILILITFVMPVRQGYIVNH